MPSDVVKAIRITPILDLKDVSADIKQYIEQLERENKELKRQIASSRQGVRAYKSYTSKTISEQSVTIKTLRVQQNKDQERIAALQREAQVPHGAFDSYLPGPTTGDRSMADVQRIGQVHAANRITMVHPEFGVFANPNYAEIVLEEVGKQYIGRHRDLDLKEIYSSNPMWVSEGDYQELLANLVHIPELSDAAKTLKNQWGIDPDGD